MHQRELKQVANGLFDVKLLLQKKLHLNVERGQTIHCLWHSDERKSAKLYEDNRIYCFTCKRMYGAYDVLIKVGLTSRQIEREVLRLGKPDTILEPRIDIKLTSELDQFKRQFIAGKIEFKIYAKHIFDVFSVVRK